MKKFLALALFSVAAVSGSLQAAPKDDSCKCSLSGCATKVFDGAKEHRKKVIAAVVLAAVTGTAFAFRAKLAALLLPSETEEAKS